MEAAGSVAYSKPSVGTAADAGARVVDRFILTLIIAASIAMSAFWAWRVPIFEEPDESAHFDYAVSIATAHRLVRARDGLLGTDVHPYTQYLEDQTNFRGTRYNRDGRVPEGYGTPSYFRNLDSNKPALASAQSLPHKIPFTAKYYPFGFYAVVAVVMEIASLATHKSLVAMFFAARFFCVILLLPTLLFSNAILRELRIPRAQRFAVLFAAGLLPTTSWVFGYIQPDNLVFVLTSLTILFGLRARPVIARDLTWLALGLALAFLCATKVQYFIATAVPVIAWLAVCAAQAKLVRLTLLRKLVLLLAPIAIVVAICVYIAYAPPMPGPIAKGELGQHFFRALNAGPSDVARYVWEQTGAAFGNYLGVGRGLISYWGSISWLMTPVVFGTIPITLGVFEIISGLTITVASLMLVRQFKVFLRLALVARYRSAAALRLLTQNLLLISYAMFLASMLAFSIFTNGEIVKQGRYFLPFILASNLCAAKYGPQALPRRYGIPFSRLMLTLLCCYSVIGSFFAIKSLNQRFYVPVSEPSAFERSLHVDASCNDLGYDIDRTRALIVRRPQPIVLCGWALDASTGEPVRGVLAQVDDLPAVALPFGLPRPDVVTNLLDDRLLFSGFHAQIRTDNLSDGTHLLRFLVVEPERGKVYAVLRLELEVF
jgi:Predicted membrane protein (DUF2142)